MKLDREIEESSSHASGYNLRLHCEVVSMFPTIKVLTQANVVEEYVSLNISLNYSVVSGKLRSAPFHERPCVPAGELFAFRFIVFQSSVVDNHPVVPKLGDKEFCVHVDTLLIVCHFVCIRHGVTCMTRSFERRERTTSP